MVLLYTIYSIIRIVNVNIHNKVNIVTTLIPYIKHSHTCINCTKYFYSRKNKLQLYSKTTQSKTYENKNLQTDTWKNTPKDKNQKQTDPFHVFIRRYIIIDLRFSNSGARPLRGARCEARWGVNKPREQNPYTMFIQNDLIRSKWGGGDARYVLFP